MAMEFPSDLFVEEYNFDFNENSDSPISKERRKPI